MDKLSVRRMKPLVTLADAKDGPEEKKKVGKDRKPKLETLPHDLSTAINMGQKMITKFNKRSRMKCNNLFTSSTTPTGNTNKNSMKTTINNSMQENSFKMNKSFLNKLNKLNK